MRLTNPTKRHRDTLSKQIIKGRSESILSRLNTFLNKQNLQAESQVIGIPTPLYRRVRLVVRVEDGRVAFWLHTEFGDLGWAVSSQGANVKARRPDPLAVKPTEFSYNDDDDFVKATELIADIISKAKAKLDGADEH